MVTFTCLVCFVLNMSMVGVDFIRELDTSTTHLHEEINVTSQRNSAQIFARGFRIPRTPTPKANTPKPKAKQPKQEPKNNKSDAPKGSHVNNQRESNREKHENADARRQKEQKKAQEKKEKNKKKNK